MNEDLKEHVSEPATWKRLLYMLLFVVLIYITAFVIAIVVVFQFFVTLVTGEPNDRLREFGGQLSVYAYQMLSFLTYNTEDIPFPFADWPTAERPPRLSTDTETGVD